MDEMVVEWTENAVQQRDCIFEYWNNHNGSTLYSEKLNRIIQSKIEQIIIYPNSGMQFKNTLYRLIRFDNFSLIYKVFEPKIIIYSVWDNRQNPKKLLEILGL